MRPHSAAVSQNVVPPIDIGTLPTSSETPRSRRSSHRPATACFTTRSSISKASGQVNGTASSRDVVSHFDSYQKDDLKELVGQTTANWLLSKDFRFNTLPLNGVMTSLKLSQEPHLTVLFPKTETTPELEYRELHQIIRDLTFGIFAMNQTPSFSFEPNHDLSSTCQLPLAYKNTFLGQLLISVDYAVKSLWHGATVHEKKRPGLADRWRSFVDKDKVIENPNDINVWEDFTNGGQQYITDDVKYHGLYDRLNQTDPTDFVARREHQFFNDHADSVRCAMNLYVSSVQTSCSSNVVAFESKFDIEGQIIAPEEKIDSSSQQKLRRRLRLQMDAVKRGIEIDENIKKKLTLLKFVAFLSPVLVALRKRMMRIPDLDNMLTLISTESIATDSKIPPFAFGEDKGRPCLTFAGPGITHAHGGISFDMETPEPSVFEDEKQCREASENAAQHLLDIFEQKPIKPDTKVSIASVDHRQYYSLFIPLTIYYAASPPQPSWVHAIYKELSSLRPKELPLSDMAVAEQFRAILGPKNNIASKGIEAQLKLIARRGLVAPFVTLIRKININALFSPDILGMTLLHYATMHNQPYILGLMLKERQSVNVRRRSPKVKSDKISTINSLAGNLEENTGLCPLHYAARSGSTECCTLLIASKANLFMSDDIGWSAIHHAAFCGHVSILRILLRKQPNLLELTATGNDNATPYLVAATGGSVDCIKFLLKVGANCEAEDSSANTAVHRATLNYHTEVLEYFVERQERNVKSLPVWDILVEMLKSEKLSHEDAALRCLEMLLHRNPAYWLPLLKAGAVQPLVSLLESNENVEESSDLPSHISENDSPICSLACSVICLMSEHDEVRCAVSSAGAITSLISLLTPSSGIATSTDRELQSRSSVVLSDLAYIDGNPSVISKRGGIMPLVRLLATDVVDVVVNALDTLRSVCQDGRMREIQNEIVTCGAVTALVELLYIKDDTVPSATASAIAEICRYNKDNQDTFIHADVLKPLVCMLNGRNFKAKVQAATAVESICHCNIEAQTQAEQEKVAEALCTMFVALANPVKEKGAQALWALAGEHSEQQRRVAKKIGFRQVKDMLNSKSEILQLVGCQSAGAIAYMSSSSQRDLADYSNMIPNLVRLLRLDTTSRCVVTALIQTISNLCIGVALVNHKYVQEKLAECGAVELLIQRVWQCTHDELLQIELLHCLACTVVGCPANEEYISQHDRFGFEIVLELMNSCNQYVRQRAVQTLTVFSYNRTPQQRKILQLGGIPLLFLEDLLSCPDDEVKAQAAFQMVILCRVITDCNFEDASARGILILAGLCDHNDDQVLITTANCIASLVHTRAGISDGFVTAGVVRKLINLVGAPNDSVRTAASQALGYLTFNRVASRELISFCRSSEGLYDAFVRSLGEDGRISDEFAAEYKRQRAVGLPIVKEWQKNRSNETQSR